MSIIAYLGTCKTETLVYLSYLYLLMAVRAKCKTAVLVPSEVPKQLLAYGYQRYCINYMRLLQGTKHQVSVQECSGVPRVCKPGCLGRCMNAAHEALGS